MYVALQVLTIMLAAITIALSLAHALELPRKLRLNKEQYFAVQPIYYPGFTIDGFAEVGVIFAALMLLFMTPSEAPEFWLVACALTAFIAVQFIFWGMTQPVNRFGRRCTSRDDRRGLSAPEVCSRPRHGSIARRIRRQAPRRRGSGI
jgi:hypothetical protein